ncbi:hypothetical protein CQ12_16780 [Bradyrhizobium jicamae]|uniref:Uncharacterized protein n=1 Tax=Bradyrhizobium jicamae TaxID=280332 RepID=A0A0R3LF94_9BRAD|nr:hypothetical protein CQ12_16780 [Bradyrhizobium jicamae]
MGADDLVAMQDTFEHANCALQNRYVEDALIPRRCIEAVDTLGTIPASETLGELPLIAAKKTDAKAAAGEYRIVSLRTRINTGQQAGRIMQIEVTELTVNPRRPWAVPTATMATPLARIPIAWRNSIGSMD